MSTAKKEWILFWRHWIEEHQYPGKLPLILSHVMCISMYYDTKHILRSTFSWHAAGMQLAFLITLQELQI